MPKPSELARQLSGAAPSPQPPDDRSGSAGGEPPSPTPPASQDNLGPARDRLGAAIAELAEEQARYDGLVAARDRAGGEKANAEDELAAAETALRDIRLNEPPRVAFAYLNQTELRLGVDIGEAQATVDHHRETVQQIGEIEDALAGEIIESGQRRTTARRALDQALATVILASSQYAELYDQLRHAWARLRSLRAVLALIDHEGHIPPPQFGRWQSTEPLDIGERRIVSDRLVLYEYDAKLLAQWQAALTTLQHDADAPLPDNGR